MRCKAPGDTKRTMKVSVAAQWGFFLPMAYLAGPVMGLGLLGIWIMQALYRTLQGGVFWWYWEQRRWAKIQL